MGSPLSSCTQLGHIGGDPPGLVAGEQVRRRAASGLVLAIHVGERLPVGVADDEAPPIKLWIGLLDDQGGGKWRSGMARSIMSASRS
jgi:hypothetical protein